MMTKQLLGIFILVSNAAGIGYLLYLGGLAVLYHFFPREELPESKKKPVKKQAPLVLEDDDILPDEDDLLKDMDLSDLDNLNLDDFE